jgi:hypothetical protein
MAQICAGSVAGDVGVKKRAVLFVVLAVAIILSVVGCSAWSPRSPKVEVTAVNAYEGFMSIVHISGTVKNLTDETLNTVTVELFVVSKDTGERSAPVYIKVDGIEPHLSRDFDAGTQRDAIYWGRGSRSTVEAQVGSITVE